MSGLWPQTAASQQAYLGIRPQLPRRRLEVYEAVAEREPRGATIAELSRALAAPDGTPRSYHLLSPRVSELVERGWLLESLETRNGMTVYRLGDGTTPKTRTKRARRRPLSARVVAITPDAEDPDVSIVQVRVGPLGLKAAPMTVGTVLDLMVPRS